MEIVFRQSTETVVRVGAFMDSVDAVTPETGVTLGAADQAELLKATGATVDISGNTFAAITGVAGWYDLTVTASNLDTVGPITLIIQDSSVCTPVWVRGRVVEEAVFDQFYATSAPGAATVAALSTIDTEIGVIDGIVDAILVDTGTTIPALLPASFSTLTIANNAAAANVTRYGGTAATTAGGIPAVNTVQWRGTQPLELVSQRVAALVGGMSTGVVTADAIAADAIGASELAADAVTEIVDAIRATVVETQGSYTLQQALSIILSVLAGRTDDSGATILTPNGAATRVAATLSANERTGMTLTPSS